MDFNENAPIYRQIADWCEENIISGQWAAGERIPSTKELCMQLQVNNRTVLRAYDGLADDGIIYQRRGMGYYVADEAASRILEARRSRFLKETVPAIAKAMRQLGISGSEILPLLP